MNTYSIGTHVVHSVEGDVGTVTGFYTRDDLVMHRVTGCPVPLPGDELRPWRVYQDGTPDEAYRQLAADCEWSIDRNDDNFLCVVNADALDALVAEGRAEKRGSAWYRAIVS